MAASLPPDAELVTVFKAGSRFEAELMVGRLNEAGIKAAYFADDGGGTHPELITSGPIRVRVHASNRAAALAIIEDSTDDNVD